MSEPLGEATASQSVPDRQLQRVERALISVSDKTGVAEFAGALREMDVEIVSTGGTARALRDAGIDVVEIDVLTGAPEMLEGRVKTLHPVIHAGVLARRDEDENALNDLGIAPIDLVCVNLYPFERTIARKGVSLADAVEQIDIGGSALIRSAAKNHRWVTVISAREQYEEVIDELMRYRGATTLGLRRLLAIRAMARTSAYDQTIAHYFSRTGPFEEQELPQALTLTLPSIGTLRYGENPHQRAALYGAGPPTAASVVGAEQLNGKELSYNNINDAAAALELACDLSGLRTWEFAACVIKHANPCGASVASSAGEAVGAALAGDPVAAYGGVLALEATLDQTCAGVLCKEGRFLEVIVAERFETSALEKLRSKWPDVRLLAVGALDETARSHQDLHLRAISGGVLVQTPDSTPIDTASWTHRAGPRPSEERLRDAAVIWATAKQLTSNAVAIGARETSGRVVRLFGAGSGQVDRLTACRIAVEKAGKAPRHAIAASDGFFPFADGPEVLLQAGVTMIVHPGGSKRDQETFDLCDRMGVTCMTTGTRHFRH